MTGAAGLNHPGNRGGPCTQHLLKVIPVKITDPGNRLIIGSGNQFSLTVRQQGDTNIAAVKVKVAQHRRLS